MLAGVQHKRLELNIVMKKIFSVFILLGLLTVACNQEQLFVASDLTAENTFSQNIEGPTWRNGLFYVVNFEKDGTVATVDMEGNTKPFMCLRLHVK